MDHPYPTISIMMNAVQLEQVKAWYAAMTPLMPDGMELVLFRSGLGEGVGYIAVAAVPPTVH